MGPGILICIIPFVIKITFKFNLITLIKRKHSLNRQIKADHSTVFLTFTFYINIQYCVFIYEPRETDNFFITILYVGIRNALESLKPSKVFLFLYNRKFFFFMHSKLYLKFI